MSIEAALGELDALKPGEQFSYTAIAKKHGVVRSTLSRRHRAISTSTTTKNINQQRLTPQQEIELIKHIDVLTARRLPPTRDMIRNFASSIAQNPVSDSWVTRFINTHRDHLTPQWNNAMDANRHAADSYTKYKLYFDLLQQKITKYSVDSRHTYNMDEKGFMTGVAGRSKRVFSKRRWDKGEVRTALQDGDREWITVLACTCADGTALPPGLIYPAKGNTVQSSWVESIEPKKHPVYFTTSPSGWTNDDVGLAWLEQVFNRHTKAKARRKYRLLIVDGHGSHLTLDFIRYCDNNRILLCILPPHSTQTTQPLDVVNFKPLSTAYKKELARYTDDGHGKVPVKKGDFFNLFWSAWVSTFTKQLILRGFEVTGISPLNPDKILTKFTNNDAEASDTSSSASCYSGEDWLKIQSLIKSTVRDEGEREAKKLRRSLHHISVQNTVLHHDVQGLKRALDVKKKHNKKSKKLDLQQRQEYHGGAVFWSPSKRREADVRYEVFKRLEMEEKLKKIDKKELAAAKKLIKEKEKEEKRVAREVAKEVREKAKADAAIQKAEKQAEKQRQKEERDAAKAIKQPQLGKRKASEATQPKKRQKRGHTGGVGSGRPPSPPPAAPTKTTSRGRNVKLPAKFK